MSLVTTPLPCIPVRCALRPPHLDLDVPLELGAQLALEHEQPIYMPIEW